MKPSKNKWRDHYSRRAQKEHYAARSVYKLAEIQKKHRLIKKRDQVLDLGCAPGSWLQFAAEQTGDKGRVVGVDLKPVTIKLPGHVQVITGDINHLFEDPDQPLGTGFSVVLSDMAPATTGNKHADAVRSFVLCETALAVAEKVLRPGGHFVCKIFQGEDFKAFCDNVKKQFGKMHIFKPQSSRKGSKEIFVIGLNKKA
ncbi:MAG: RlmE family RNA methyltransferase [Desulfobacteraceae bacterium]|jgi:23S rRNA (uridine2552-2'-O)-methyltransferase